MEINKIYQGDAKEVLENLPDKSINMCVTSPPYWGLRDYGVKGQLGLEDTPEQYVERLVNIFSEVKRVLKDDGTLWLNLGDSYAGNCSRGSTGSRSGFSDEKSREGVFKKTGENLKPKDLVGIPWRVAFALQENGWYLRNDIIWHKGNPMPESVTDRCTTSHEHIFLLAKSKKYYFNQDAIKEKAVANKGKLGFSKKTAKARNKGKTSNGGNEGRSYSEQDDRPNKKNKRDVWQVNTKPFPEAHFAVYPPDLIRPCIKAGCPDDGIVLDPFIGAGTTSLVALQEDKNFVGIELNQEYIDIAYKRIGKFNKKYYDELPEEEKPKQMQMF